MKEFLRPFQDLLAFSSLAALLLLAPLPGQAQDYTYIITNDTITITRYTGPGGAVSIPASIAALPVTAIAAGAFGDCTTLTNVTVPYTVTNMGDVLFITSPNLTSIGVDPGNPAYSSLEGVLFDKGAGTLLEFPRGITGSYTVPNSVSKIGGLAFCNCTSLTSILMPDNLTEIGDNAFYHCASLSSVTIPNSVTSIGYEAFWACSSLTSVTIPNSVTFIGGWAFQSCTSLTGIGVDPGNPAYTSLEGVLFDKGINTLLQFPGGKTGSYAVPSSVSKIGGHAFYNSPSLTSVTIPNSVTNIREWAFAFCTGLTNTTLGDTLTTIGPYAFWNCSSLTGVTIGNRVTSIGGYAFAYCTQLRATFFKGHAPTVGSGVFDGGSTVTVYYLPGTRGWGTTFGGQPTTPWFLPQPLILALPPDFGVQTNCFGFRVSWATNASLAIEACTELTTPWVSVATNTLTDGWFYFSSPGWGSYPARFYRVRSP